MNLKGVISLRNSIWLTKQGGRKTDCQRNKSSFSRSVASLSLPDDFLPYLQAATASKVPRWAQQVLFSLKTVRFEFAEPSMSIPPPAPASTLWSSFLFSLETDVSNWPNMMIRWPTLQTTKQPFLAWKPSVSECLPAACGLIVGTFFSLQGSSTSELARSFD